MAIELKDAAELLGIEVGDDDTVDTLKEKLHGKWIPVDLLKEDSRVKAITGQAFGNIYTSLQRSAKAAGLEVADADLKDKKVEEAIEVVFGKVGNKFKELETSSGDDKDTKYKKLEGELNTWKTKASEYEGLHKTTLQQLEEKEQQFTGEIRKFKLGHKLNEIESKIQFSDTANELVKRGFKTLLSEKYRLDLNDKDEVEVYDTKTNERVKNDKGNALASWEEVLTREAKTANILKVSDVNKNGTGFQRYQPNGNGSNGSSGGNNGGQKEQVNFIHPDALT